jgi:N-acetylmuramoyl-L-alanine amidase
MLPDRRPAVRAALTVFLAAGCARRAPSAGPIPIPTAADTAPLPSRLPPVAPVRGPLALRVVYPPTDAVLQVRDSTFLFGSSGSGDAAVTINGQPARVWPNGAWLAYVALPADSIVPLQIVARTATDSARVIYPLRRAVPEAGRRTVGGAWIDSLSLSPVGRAWVGRNEYVALRARAAEGAQVRLVLADGTVVPLVPQPEPVEVPVAVRAFERDTAVPTPALTRDRYVGLLRGRAVGPDPGPVVAFPGGTSPPDTNWATVEAIAGADTARVHWPLQVAVLDSIPVTVEFDDDTSGTGTSDSLTVGRAIPGGTYAWFFPTGTRGQVSGRRNDELRLRLGADAEAWVPAADARPLAPGGPAPAAVVGSVRLIARPDRVSLRIPISQRVPFRVEEGERTLAVTFYGAVGDVDWMRYGATDSLVRRLTWRQDATDQVTLSLELGMPVWGYRSRWDRADFVLDVRRPPAIDAGHPLRDRVIAIDPGHPPGGATGPTGLREAEANLGVALEVERLLTAEGAKVIMTRTSDSVVDLWPRVARAEQAGAEVLVSIHNNALPDGLNPFINHGTSVYYHSPRSVPLARTTQAALVRRLGLRDLGIGWGDLALVRGTWMPSILTEGLFMMLPDQEAALRTPQGRGLYAQAVVDGLRSYLHDWADRE